MADSDGIAANGGLAGLVQLHRGELLRFLTARCGDPAEAEDLLQDLCLKAGRIAAGPIANGRTYLFKMANNLVVDRVRSRQRAMRRDRGWLERDGSSAAVVEERPDPAADAEANLLETEEAEILREAIRALPDGARRALLLYRFEGHGQSEIAAIMGISRSGVEKHLALAMRHLRQRLADCGYFEAAPSHQRTPASDATPDGNKDQ